MSEQLTEVLKDNLIQVTEIKKIVEDLTEQVGDTQAVEELKELINRQSSDIEGLKNKKTVLDVSKYLEQPKGISFTMFGGANAYITYKWLLSFIGIVLVSYFGFKYGSSYLVELEKSKTNNIFVNYLKLQQFKEKGNTKLIDSYLDNINSSDSTFFKAFEEYKAYSEKETERINTEKKIKELQNKLESTKK